MSTIRSHLSLNRHPNLFFWLCFALLNGLLFLPLYALNTDSTSFLPLAGPDAERSHLLHQLWLWRENLDPFRLSAELVLLVSLWVFIARARLLAVRILMVALYLVGLVYYLYEAIIVSLYQVDPVFYVQYFLFADGLQFLLEHLNISPAMYVGMAALVILALVAVLSIASALFSPTIAAGLSRASRLALALLLVGAVASTAYQQESAAEPRMVVSSLVYKLRQNIDASLLVYEDVVAFDDSAIRRSYDYSAYPLRRKPNIYLIFVESYGSVLYKRDDFKAAYVALLDELDDRLGEAGWQTMSALSESPTWGGGSWMAYTSALFGYRIDSHPQFLSLFNKYQIDQYPDLGRYLVAQGYESIRLSSISVELKEEEWLRYRNFYGVDRWLRNRDLAYVGPGYGWGPAPPDQFALGLAQEQIDRDVEKPIFFFTITQNSHYPWDPMPQLADDWRQLNQPGPEPVAMSQELIAHETRRQNYFNAVDYQLRFLTEHIISRGEEDAIFILAGDHQPPRVSRRSDGWDTPVHVIARDPALLASFAEYGFNPGLRSASEKPVMRHEGLYSMLVRILVANYGEDVARLPEYLPGGVMVSEQIATHR